MCSRKKTRCEFWCVWSQPSLERPDSPRHLSNSPNEWKKVGSVSHIKQTRQLISVFWTRRKFFWIGQINNAWKWNTMATWATWKQLNFFFQVLLSYKQSYLHDTYIWDENLPDTLRSLWTTIHINFGHIYIYKQNIFSRP